MGKADLTSPLDNIPRNPHTQSTKRKAGGRHEEWACPLTSPQAPRDLGQVPSL